MHDDPALRLAVSERRGDSPLRPRGRTDALAVAASTVAQAHEATLWTQDVDFEGLQGVQFKAKGGALS